MYTYIDLSDDISNCDQGEYGIRIITLFVGISNCDSPGMLA